MRVDVNGKRWQLRFAHGLKNRGDCDSPTIRGKEIRVDAGLAGRERLEVIIHELLHAGCWWIDEELIEPLGADIARVLWRLGYREGTE